MSRAAALLALALILSGVWVAPERAFASSSPTGGASLELFVGKDVTARRLAKRVRLDVESHKRSGTRELLWAIGDQPKGRWSTLLGRVRAGAGLVVLLVDHVPPSLGLGARTLHETRASLIPTHAAPAPLGQWVVWPSAPQVGHRWKLSPRDPAWRAWVVSQKTSESVILERRLGRGRIIVLAMALGHASNYAFILWPYFNYMLHVLGSLASRGEPMLYGEWPASPVPGLSSLWIIGLILLVAWVVTLGLFFRARRISRARPEILDSFFPAQREAVPAQREAVPAQREADLDAMPAKDTAWRTIGFSRPLAGFLTLAAALFVLFVPFYWLTNVLVPNKVQPFPQARGMWDFAWEALQMAWFLFDAGTFVAFVKYFAEYRVKDPKEALRSAQFFVWWQILTGLVQVSLACLAAVVILPNTRYGYTSSFVILVALGQYPGFFGVVTFFFQAYQRFDYNIALDLLSDWILRFVLLIPFVLLFRQWGVAHPAYGEAFGAAVGIGVGYYVSSLVSFGLGIVLYRRLGLSLMPLFLAHFDGATAKRMLSYGLRVVAGKFLYRAAQAIDTAMISVLLLNYTEWLGLKGQISYNLMFLFPVAYRFFETSMASLSESYGNDKKTLTQYYLARYFQVGSLYAAIGLSLLLALGPLFVRNAMDPQWARAADYLVLAAAIGAFFAPAWLSDMLQKGAGRPGLFAIVLGLEQVARIGLFWILIPSLQFTGFYLAILLTIILKVFGSWIVNHLLILRLRIYLWQMFIAPLLTGLATYGIFRGVAAWIAPTGALVTTVLFLGAALFAFPLCFFFFGLFGGTDRAFADEFDQASEMTGLLRPLTRFFYHVARAGWSRSPLFDRFPMTISDAAAREAKELQELMMANTKPGASETS